MVTQRNHPKSIFHLVISVDHGSIGILNKRSRPKNWITLLPEKSYGAVI
jgi:hypothetical protein